MHSEKTAPARPGEDSVDEQAAGWLAAREDGLSAEREAEFVRWRDADPRHERAVRRLESAQMLLARLPDTSAAADLCAEVDALCAAHEARTNRAFWRRAAAGLAAAACVAFAVALAWPESPAGVHATAAGDRRSVDLPDGSTLLLSGNSELRVAFAAAERRLDLRHGEARFTVAKDESRPFLVSAGAVTVRAVGTVFTVRREAGAVDVLVTEGKVAVSRAAAAGSDSAALESVQLVAGERVLVDVAPHAASGGGVLPPLVVRKDPARDTPLIEFDNSSLAEAVEHFNRYSRVQMEIADPELGASTLGGTFDASNAESFINLLIAVGDIRIERVSETRIVLHSAR